LEPFGRTVSWFFRAGCRTRYCSRDADNCAVRPAKARVYSFNSPAMEALATLTTALSVPRNLWFIHSTPPRRGSRDADHSVISPAKSRVYSFNSRAGNLAMPTAALSNLRNPEVYSFNPPPARMTQSLREAATGDEDEI